MKQNQYVLAVLFSGISATGLGGIDTLPALTGTPITISYGDNDTKTSCYQCIRSDWVWCSSRWHYEEASANASYTQSTENGQCCFAKATLAADEFDKDKGNVTKCKARYNNTSAATSVSQNSSATFWCSWSTTESEQPKSMELMLVNCRQLKSICGGANLQSLADKAATAIDLTVTGMTATEKCSWNLKTLADAPTFKITSTGTSIVDDYELHYIEYTDTASLETSGSSQPTDWLDPSNTLNTVAATMYNKVYNSAQEYPPVYTVPNPQDVVSLKKKRWFPGQIAYDEIVDYNSRAASFATSKASYDTLRNTYNTALSKSVNKSNWLYDLFQTPEVVTIPSQPLPPTQPAAFVGYNYNKDQTGTASATSKSQIAIASDNGGWGSLTMGILPITNDYGKSFGIFGMGPETVTSPTLAGTARSFLAIQADMPLTKNKYIVLSLWPSKWTSADQSSDTFKITFAAKDYYTALTTDWKAPTTPDAPILPNTAAVGGADRAQTLIASSLALYSFIYNLV